MSNETEATIGARADAVVQHHRELLRDLVKMRERHGLSQADMAYRMGVSQPAVAAFERYDANPTLSTIRRYAIAVGARFRGAVVDDYIEMDGWNSLIASTFTFETRRPQPETVAGWSRDMALVSR